MRFSFSLLLATLAWTRADPCDDDQFKDTDVCKAKAKGSGCGGPDCWSCDGPLTSTECVESSWTNWKGEEDKFQAKCSGQLVRWGQDSGVQDCGNACLFCSDIRACCDTCTTILKVTGEWKKISCLDVDTQVTYQYGVQSTESSSWSRSETWSTNVKASSTAKGIVEGVEGEMTLSAESSHSLTDQTSGSWSVTTSSNTSISFTQPAETCSWHWETTITDSCGVRTADSKDNILTRGDQRGNPPCCLPGIAIDNSTGECYADNAGNVVDLCKKTQSLTSLTSLSAATQPPTRMNNSTTTEKALLNKDGDGHTASVYAPISINLSKGDEGTRTHGTAPHGGVGQVHTAQSAALHDLAEQDSAGMAGNTVSINLTQPESSLEPAVVYGLLTIVAVALVAILIYLCVTRSSAKQVAL